MQCVFLVLGLIFSTVRHDPADREALTLSCLISMIKCDVILIMGQGCDNLNIDLT